MIGRLIGSIAKLVLALAGLAMLTMIALFVVGAFLATYPILRLPPRQRHLKAALDLAAAVAAAVAVFKGEAFAADAEGTGPPASGTAGAPPSDRTYA